MILRENLFHDFNSRDKRTNTPCCRDGRSHYQVSTINWWNRAPHGATLRALVHDGRDGRTERLTGPSCSDRDARKSKVRLHLDQKIRILCCWYVNFVLYHLRRTSWVSMHYYAGGGARVVLRGWHRDSDFPTKTDQSSAASLVSNWTGRGRTTGWGEIAINHHSFPFLQSITSVLQK